MLLGERWEKLPGWHGINMAEPESASDYIERFGDQWRDVPDSAEFLRTWWHAEPVRAWMERIYEVMKELEDTPPGDDRNSLLFHHLSNYQAEATLRALASEVVPDLYLDYIPRKKPFVASLDQVQITRDGEDAFIEYADPDVGGTRLVIGPELEGLSNQDVLDMHNEILRATADRREAGPYIAVEIPFGQPQIEFEPEAALWSPRGDILRCTIEDPNGELGVRIDDRILTAQEFAKMLLSYTGWSLRIALVPKDDVEQEPTVVMRDLSGAH